MMRILINTPSLRILGGVANHYAGLKEFWTANVKYNTVGRRSEKGCSGKYWLPWDIVKFVFKLFTFCPDVVLVNPSLGNAALKRDFLFMNIARCLGFKVAVFIHGFNLDYAQKVDKPWICKNLNRASLIFVLAKLFKETLGSWGIETPIVLATTKVNDNLIRNFKISQRIGNVKNILFLARVEEEKGIYIVLKIYEILKKEFPFLTLSIVGGGSKLDDVREYTVNNRLADVRIAGPLSGNDLIREFEMADLYLFPSYGEGMPTSVLEAMAFGLPVFTRYVGGLSDFFLNEKMGFITDSLEPQVYVAAIKTYILNPNRVTYTASFNHFYACEHFMASKVAQSIENQLRSIL